MKKENNYNISITEMNYMYKYTQITRLALGLKFKRLMLFITICGTNKIVESLLFDYIYQCLCNNDLLLKGRFLVRSKLLRS